MKFLRHQWVKDLGLFLALFPWVVAPGVWVNRPGFSGDSNS